MHSRQGFVLEALWATQGFLDKDHDLLKAVNASGVRRNLDHVIQQVVSVSVDQGAGRMMSVGQTAALHQVREDLRLLHMKPITVIAQARLREVPEMVEFSLPAAATPPTRLIASAHAMAEATAKHLATFVESGLPEDCVAELEAAAQALEDALTTRTTTFAGAVGATASLASLEKQARHVLRVLDALIAPRLRLDDGLATEWRSVRHIRRKSGPPRGAEPAVTAASTEAASTEVAMLALA